MSLKITDKDWDFLMKAVIFALLIMALLHAFKPYTADAPAAVNQAEVEAIALASVAIKAQDIGTAIASSQKPTFLMVYASWCGYCRKTMPHMVSLWRQHTFEGMQLLMVSVDESKMSLAQYIISSSLRELMPAPVMLKQYDGSSLPEILQAMGAVGYTGGIPYMALFKAGGGFAGEIRGYANERDILGVLENVR